MSQITPNSFFTSLLQEPTPYSPSQIASLWEVLARPVRWNHAQLLELAQLARNIGAVMESLPSHSTDGCRWIRAAHFEAAGRSSEAAEILEGLWEGCWGEERAQRLLAAARNHSRCANWDLAARRLAEVAQHTKSYRTLASVDRLLKQLRGKTELPARRKCRVALLGTLSVDFWLPALRAQCFGSGLDVQFHVGPFGQAQQELLNPSSSTFAFKPDIVVIASDWRSFGFPEESNDPAEEVQQRLSALRALWRTTREKLGAFVIQLNAEIPAHDPFGRLSAALPGGLGRMLRTFNLQLWDAERSESGVAVLDVEQAAANYGKLQWADPVLWHAAKQYPSANAIPTLTHHLTALLRAVLGLSAKCVAVDLDGVLWGGVIGEDGLGGIQIGGGPVGEAHAAFQKYLKALAGRGILLAACSKNNLEDALLPFREHREMV